MKKYFYLLFILNVFYTPNLFAQEKKFSNQAEIYKYWAKRFNVTYTYSYMKKAEKTDDEIKGVKDYNKKFLKKIDEQTMRDFYHNYTLIDSFLYNNSWKTTRKKSFLKLDTLIEKQLKNKEYSLDTILNYKYAYKSKNNTSISHEDIILKKTIKESYNKDNTKFLKEISKDNGKELGDRVISQPLIKQTNHNTPTSTITEKQEAEKKGREGITFFDFPFKTLLFFLLIGAMAMYFFIMHQIKKVLGTEYDTIRKESNYIKKDILPIVSIIRHLKEQKDKNMEEKPEDKDEEGMGVTTESENLSNDEPKEVPQTTETPTPTSPEKTPIEEPDKSKPAVKKPSVKIVFYDMPESDGSFKLHHAKEDQDIRKFYKIVFNVGSNKGIIHYISNNQHDKRAIKRYESYLNPVCIIKDLDKRPSANSVICEEPGKVYLLDNRWHIESNEKIKVKFV